MGRSFASIRQGVKNVAEHWGRVPRELREADRGPADRLVAAAKRHGSAAFYGCDDPLEAAIFSALVEIARYQGDQEDAGVPDVDP